MAFLMNMAAFDRGSKLIEDMQREERQAKLDERQAELDARERDRYDREKADYNEKKSATTDFVSKLKQDTDASDVDSFFSKRAPQQAHAEAQVSPGPAAEGAQDVQADNPNQNNVVAAQPDPAKPLATMATTVQQPFQLPPEILARRNLLIAEAEFAAKTNPSALPAIREKLQKFDLGAKASEVHKRVSTMDQNTFNELVKRADLNPQIEVKAVDDGKGGTVLTIGEKKVSLNRQQAADWLTGMYLRDQGDLEGGKAMIAGVSKELADASTKYQDALFKVRSDNRGEVQSGLAVKADGRADDAATLSQNRDSREQLEFNLKIKQLEQEGRLSPQAKLAVKEIEMLNKAIADGMAKDTFVATSENGKELLARLATARLAFDVATKNTSASAAPAAIPFNALNGQYGGKPTTQPAGAQPSQTAAQPVSQPSAQPTSKFASTPAEQDRVAIYSSEYAKAQEAVRTATTPEALTRAQNSLNELVKEIKSNRIPITTMEQVVTPAPAQQAAPAATPTPVAQPTTAPVTTMAQVTADPLKGRSPSEIRAISQQLVSERNRWAGNPAAAKRIAEIDVLLNRINQGQY